MNDWSGIEAIAAAVGAVAGVGGFIAAGLANRRTKQANKLAQAANDLATEALGKAREANEIAEHANELSEDANAIARAQAVQQSDPAHIEWRAKWDKEASVARITNHGRDVALDVSVLVDPKNVGEVIRADDAVPRGGQIVVPFPEVPEQREKHKRITSERVASARANGVIVIPRTFGRDVELDVRWVSEAGKPGQQIVKFHLS